MDPGRPEIGPRLQLGLSLAREAAEVLLSHFGRLERVERKGAVDLVTEADREAERLVRGRIAAAFPEDAFLGEETGAGGAIEAAYTWIVDPLDGTTNFVHGLPHFAVSIGVVHGGEPVVGVVRHPPLGLTYHAVLGGGAFADERPIRVSTTAALGDALLATGFPYDRRDRPEELLRPVARALAGSRGVRRFGAAALDLCDVARGAFDGFFEATLSPWDVAAGALLVREAGGTVTAYDEGPLRLDGPGSILASNGRIHAALAALVSDG